MTAIQGLYDLQDKTRDRRMRSAMAILDVVWGYFQPGSMIDLGCGLGFLLADAQRRGVTRIRGVEAGLIEGAKPQIPLTCYDKQDLNDRYQPGVRYDLAVSCEVAEHLKPKRSETFVQDLAALSDRVLFSAAIPGQKGIGHINLRWQGDWAKMFRDEGYRCYDPLRRKLAAREDVLPWFGVNLLLYIKDGTEVPEGLIDHEIRAEAASYASAGRMVKMVDFFQKRIHAMKEAGQADPFDPDCLVTRAAALAELDLDLDELAAWGVNQIAQAEQAFGPAPWGSWVKQARVARKNRMDQAVT